MNRIYFLLLTFLSSGFSGIGYGQVPISKNAVWLDVLGNGVGYYSLNYERLIFPKVDRSFQLTARIGASYWQNYQGVEERDLFWRQQLLGEINMVFLRGKHHFDAGAGGVAAYQRSWGAGTQPPYQGKPTIEDGAHFQGFTLRLGYRFQKETRGLYFRPSLLAMIFSKRSPSYSPVPIFPWLGLGLGYAW